MFDFGTWGEILIIVITALIVIGPKDLPKTLRALGHWVYKIRGVTQQVRGYVDELAFKAQREEIISSTKKERDERNRRD